MATDVLKSGWGNYTARPYYFVTNEYGTVYKVPVRGWSQMSGERLQKAEAFLKSTPTPLSQPRQL